MTNFIFCQRKNLILTFLDRRQRGRIRSMLLVIDWLVRWLVGNAVYSEKAVRIFLNFSMKVGNYKGRKSQNLIFEKKFLI